MLKKRKETIFMCEKNLSRTDKNFFCVEKSEWNKRMVFLSFGRKKFQNALLLYLRSLSCAEIRESLINDLQCMKISATFGTHFLKYTMQIKKGCKYKNEEL